MKLMLRENWETFCGERKRVVEAILSVPIAQTSSSFEFSSLDSCGTKHAESLTYEQYQWSRWQHEGFFFTEILMVLGKLSKPILLKCDRRQHSQNLWVYVLEFSIYIFAAHLFLFKILRNKKWAGFHFSLDFWNVCWSFMWPDKYLLRFGVIKLLEEI